MGSIMLNGISYTSGGADVEANPQDTPSDTLSTIGIDGVVYEIEGGGGGSGGIGGLDWNNKVTVTTSVIPPQGNITYTPTNPGVLIVSGYGTTDTLNVVISSSSMEDFYAPLIRQSWTSSQIIVNANEELTIANGSSGVTMGGFMVYFVPFLNGGSSSSGIHYSTDEQVIGTWIDGKPLYQKTFDLTALQLTDNNWNNNILGTIGIKIKHYEGLFSIGQAEPIFPYNYIRSSTQYCSSTLNDDASDVNVRPNINAGTLYAGIVTVQYTKITD